METKIFVRPAANIGEKLENNVKLAACDKCTEMLTKPNDQKQDIFTTILVTFYKIVSLTCLLRLRYRLGISKRSGIV